jgi:hypothetical protein
VVLGVDGWRDNLLRGDDDASVALVYALTSNLLVLDDGRPLGLYWLCNLLLCRAWVITSFDTAVSHDAAILHRCLTHLS